MDEYRETEIYRTKEEIIQFFKDQGVEYLERTRVAWKPLFYQQFEKSPYYLENEKEGILTN